MPSVVLRTLGRSPSAWRAVFRSYWIGAALNTIYDWTFRYLEKIIQRADRIAHIKIISTYGQEPINKLFAAHKISIAQSILRDRQDVTAEQALGVLRLNTLEVKSWYLLQFLGKRELRSSLEKLSVEPVSLYPTWNPGHERRRISSRRADKGRNPNATERRVEVRYGRRDYDQPLIHEIAWEQPLAGHLRRGNHARGGERVNFLLVNVEIVGDLLDRHEARRLRSEGIGRRRNPRRCTLFRRQCIYRHDASGARRRVMRSLR